MSQNYFPDEEGIETHATRPHHQTRLLCQNYFPDEEGIETVRRVVVSVLRHFCQNYFPDEEGIETEGQALTMSKSDIMVKTTSLMKKGVIKRDKG